MLSICYQKVLPKVIVELTRGHSHRFLSLVRVVLIKVIRRDLFDRQDIFLHGFVPKCPVVSYSVIKFVINSVIKF